MTPLLISKINTFAQIILAVTLIFSQLGNLHAQILNGLMTVVMCTTVASGYQYVLEWSRRAARIAHKQA